MKSSVCYRRGPSQGDLNTWNNYNSICVSNQKQHFGINWKSLKTLLSLCISLTRMDHFPKHFFMDPNGNMNERRKQSRFHDPSFDKCIYRAASNQFYTKITHQRIGSAILFLIQHSLTLHGN